MPYTEEGAPVEETRMALLLAGIREIENGGIGKLSLRKVAVLCGVSCAAPYRHFESKDSFVFEIISYVNSQWALLKERIVSLFGNDKTRLLTELCTATVLFWRANPHFKSVIMLDDKELTEKQIKEKNRMVDEISETASELCGNADDEATLFLVRSVMYGAAADESVSVSLIKSCLLNILPPTKEKL